MTLYGTDYDGPDDPWADEARDGDFKARMIDGATFVLDVPEDVPTVWGHGSDVLWAQGEALIIAGGSGVGKTTMAAQLVRARLGLQSEVLGLPVQPTNKRVLYLAMDRPAQARRALARLFKPEDRDALSSLVFWKGPPPMDAAKDTSILYRLCAQAEADTLVVDSLKDAAIGLSEDVVGAGYNRARQVCLAEGIEVLELHHNVKRGVDGKAPTSIADVYGSAWIVNGAGSVIGLHGDPGDPVVAFRHLKQPAETVGPWSLMHDHEAGITTVQRGVDLVELARNLKGLTVSAAAAAVFDTRTPSRAETEKARRRLDKLVSSGHLVLNPPTEGQPSLYRLAALTDYLGAVS